jgi:hypothetical protein
MEPEGRRATTDGRLRHPGRAPLRRGRRRPRGGLQSCPLGASRLHERDGAGHLADRRPTCSIAYACEPSECSTKWSCTTTPPSYVRSPLTIATIHPAFGGKAEHEVGVETHRFVERAELLTRCGGSPCDRRFVDRGTTGDHLDARHVDPWRSSNADVRVQRAPRDASPTTAAMPIATATAPRTRPRERRAEPDSCPASPMSVGRPSVSRPPDAAVMGPRPWAGPPRERAPATSLDNRAAGPAA